MDRGGDVTYHGPGQAVGYPIVALRRHGLDAHRYLRDLEEVLIRRWPSSASAGGRVPGMTGVWVDNAKIAAIGVKFTRWVTSHGFALNVNTDLSYFEGIIPCGLKQPQRHVHGGAFGPAWRWRTCTPRSRRSSRPCSAWTCSPRPWAAAAVAPGERAARGPRERPRRGRVRTKASVKGCEGPGRCQLDDNRRPRRAVGPGRTAGP